jgi:octaheme c-type cytochrome (tetrathionate reductase family)
MRRGTLAVLIVVTLGVVAILAAGQLVRRPRPVSQLQQLKQRLATRHQPSVDHSKLFALLQPINSPLDATLACLSCHTERGKEVMASSHWNWTRTEYVPGRGIRTIGKKNILNNFCIGVSSNLEGCDSCHAGYGLVDASFNFQDARNIDCLVCHDTTNTYTKTNRGVPSPSVDLRNVAQHVGRPQRANCGTCHFFGGGGNNVKHGDLEEALFEPSRDLDVHMASDGANLQCVDCHLAENHRMLGKLYSVSSMNRNRSTCEQCHTALPHDDDLLNEHTLKVACQTCHIPAYARANATKMTWDWSTAGQLQNGQPIERKNRDGNLLYASIKGTFTWGKNVTPEYIWFNGTAGHYLLGDSVPADKPIAINTLYGAYDDPDAKIIPVKIHRARQPYDPVNRILLQPKLYAPAKGEGALWREFDWGRSLDAGMRDMGLPYSGQYRFVRTEMTWPVNHMVAPKEKALACTTCHTREHSRLAGLRDVYLPGRDQSRVLDWLGSGALLAVIAGVLLHGTARVTARRRRGKR